jgi:ribonuclease T2
MRARCVVFSAAALLLSGLARNASADDAVGRFDFWVLTLSWFPQYCETHLSEDRCRLHTINDDTGFVVLGLAPQNEHGDSPSRCARLTRVDRPIMERLLPIMGDPKQIEHEWNHHGNCSGLDQTGYFDLVERAHRQLEIPSAFRSAKDNGVTTRSALLQAFHETNPQFPQESFALRCAGSYLREVNVCYDTAMSPRACAGDVANNCDDKIKLRANVIHR